MTSSDQRAASHEGRQDADLDPWDESFRPLLPIVRERLTALRASVRSGWRGFDTAACVVLAVQLAIVSFVVFPGSFYLDDLRLQSQASHGMGAGYLFAVGANHFAPGPRFVAWLQTELAPLNHTTAAATQVALQMLASVLVYRLVRRLWGPRRGALVPLAAYALNPMLLPVDAWWIQSIALLPVHVALAGAALAHVRYLQSGDSRWGFLGAGLFAAGLLFWEVAVLVPLLVGLLTLLYFPAARGWRALPATLRKHWPVWTAYVGVGAVYGVVYLTQRYGLGGSTTTSEEVLHMLRNQLGKAFLPALLGGPWSWRTGSSFFGIADPTPAAVVISALLVGGLVVATLRRGWRAWLLLAACFALNFAIVAIGRLALFGPDVGLDYRYLSVLAVPAALAVGLAVLPLPVGSTLASRSRRRVPAWRLQPAVLHVFLAMLALSTAVTAVNFSHKWHDNPVGGFLANAKADLAARHGKVNLYDTDVPTDVLPEFFAPANAVSNVLAPITGSATTFNDPRQLFMLVDDDGHLVGTQLAGTAHGLPGPNGGCGYAITPDSPTASVPLDHPLPRLRNITIRVEFIAAAATTVRLSVADAGEDPTPVTRTPRPLRLGRGLGALVVQAPPQTRVAEVLVGPVSPPTFLCVTSVSVGVPTPIRLPARAATR